MAFDIQVLVQERGQSRGSTRGLHLCLLRYDVLFHLNPLAANTKQDLPNVCFKQFVTENVGAVLKGTGRPYDTKLEKTYRLQ